MPKEKSIRKALVIGSGPIVIGQAAEFDYAGTQACRVLRDEGVNVVLVNSNPATIMTDKLLAHELYIEPLNLPTLRRIIKKERPDSILPGLGGQTGLTLAMQLYRDGTLEKYAVRMLGTDINGIENAEDRERFCHTMQKIGQPVVPSGIAGDVDTALSIAREIGCPVIVRPAYTLGGTGGGIAQDERELRKIAQAGLNASPIGQILVEKCISGWKEIEFEIMRDAAGKAIAVCAMENVDPMGIHTGDSIVVAPTMTLADRELKMLRAAALKIAEGLKIVGGCNCQFALEPESGEYAVIEVNPRVSRSSALASKATGYPIARISTLIALGYTLEELSNGKTGKTAACFEPVLDYFAVKLPRWPFEKFPGASRKLGTQMKATGEVMAIGRSFEEALMKAVRGSEISLDSLNSAPINEKSLIERLREQDDRRIFTVFEALKKGVSIEEIYQLTKIDRFFLHRLEALAVLEKELAAGLDPENYRRAKRCGYPDSAIRRISGEKTLPEFHYSYRAVDTCSGEPGEKKPYFYSCCDADFEGETKKPSGRPVIMVLGSGPIRIGQGIEFDYSCVHCVWTLRRLSYDVVIVNNNPETVSTDYDTADRLYFEPLCPEDVMGIIEKEKPIGVVVAFGGETAINLTRFLNSRGIPILGTSAESIDLAEDRERFDALLERIHIRRPPGLCVTTADGAVAAAEKLGFPVLLRPSYVIGGQSMAVARDAGQVVSFIERIIAHGIENPVLVDKYLPGTELEADVISDGENVLIPGIMEHIEHAGIHSGDSIAVYPPYDLSAECIEKICTVSETLALALGTRGLVNIQYLIFEGELYVIEVNPRASRTVPFISKVTGVPMVDIASRVMLGAKLPELGYGTGLYPAAPYFAVKVPVFSFDKLNDADPRLGPEMKSTGEVLGIGKTSGEALFKGLSAALFRFPHKNAEERSGILLSGDESDPREISALAELADSRFTAENTELMDINTLYPAMS